MASYLLVLAGCCGGGGSDDVVVTADGGFVFADVITDSGTFDATLRHTFAGPTDVTLLRAAVKILGDGVGNDAALCESGEVCLFSSSLGAYQGHGALESAGTFVDSTTGGLTGITLQADETLGY